MESRINDDDEQITTVYYPTFLSGPFLNEEGESEETDSIDEITEVGAKESKGYKAAIFGFMVWKNYSKKLVEVRENPGLPSSTINDTK
ncbi:hypothetical protein PS6_000279 [Mucor atramentarius]